jgi:F0F1-type ATP synthase assembly protein I
MFKFNLVGAGFLGFLGVWLKSWPLSIIIILVIGLMAYDIVKGLREVRTSSSNGG